MNPSASRKNSIDYFRAPALDGLEVVRNGLGEGQVGRHAHRCLVAGVVLAGRHVTIRDGQEHAAGPGRSFVIPPGQMHACFFCHGCVLECLCVPQAVLDRFGPGEGADFMLPSCADPELFRMLRECMALARGEDAQALGAALRAVLRRVSELARPASPHVPPDPLVADLRHRLEITLPEPVDCASLARAAGLAPWELSRRFTAVFGAGPRDLAMLLRVDRAKKLLAGGASLAEAGLQAGFYDQSHFSRRFSRVVGMSPGQYARAWRKGADSP